jgi:DNA-binding MarR family transcriptional regulator
VVKKFPSSFETPSVSPGFLLWKVTHLWQRKQRDTLKEIDLTHVQFVVLAGLGWLQKVNKNISQAELARHAEIDEMMASSVIRTLEKKKLLKRHKHPTDTRARVLALTSEGERVMMLALERVERVDREFFKNVSQTEAVQLLQTLLD